MGRARANRASGRTAAVRSVTVVGLVAMMACTSGTSPSPASVSPSGSSTSQTASPSTPTCPWPHGGSCLGPLAAGTYTTSVFQPTLTYRLPAGWGNFEDLPGNFLLIPPGGYVTGVGSDRSDYVGVYTSIAAQTPTCETASIRRSPTDLAAYFAADTRLQTTTPKKVSVGGLDGVVLDLSLAQGSHKHGACLIEGLTPSSLDQGPGQGVEMRLYLLALHDPIFGGTLLIEIDDVSGGGHLDKYSSVVKDFHFKP